MSCVEFSVCMYFCAASVWLYHSVHPSVLVSSMDVQMEREPGNIHLNCPDRQKKKGFLQQAVEGTQLN